MNAQVYNNLPSTILSEKSLIELSIFFLRLKVIYLTYRRGIILKSS